MHETAPPNAPDSDSLDIFFAVQPGLETLLQSEVQSLGFNGPKKVPGGVTLKGDWEDVWRANLWVRGASRILVRIGTFRALHLAQLDKRATQLPWRAFLRSGTPIQIEASCRKSKIYHSGAAAQRVGEAAAKMVDAKLKDDAAVKLFVRIENDLCTVSVDTSGAPLHKRGFKQAVNKAPMRETLAAMFLRACRYKGDEPLVDPMCGSGTFVIEAAEMAMDLAPGRTRSFAFEELASFQPDAWAAMRAPAEVSPPTSRPMLFGFDRDPGAIEMSGQNADRAGVTGAVQFAQRTIGDLTPPDTTDPDSGSDAETKPRPPASKGLVIINPPYGARIGNPAQLAALYKSTGKTLRERFAGWRVGLITNDDGLARATRLPFETPSAPVPHGSLRIRLYQTGPLPGPLPGPEQSRG